MPCTKESLKGKFPFRLGTTSYIIPDDLIPNVSFLGPQVDDVELVLFESEDISNLPDKKVLEQMARLKSNHDLSFTIHLPLDIELGSLEEAIRYRSVEKCRKVMDLCGDLDPFGYIVHFHGRQRGNTPTSDMPAWRKALSRSAKELVSQMGHPEKLCVETLDYPFAMVADIVTEHGMAICLDVGHLAFFDHPVADHLDAYWDACRVIHLHGNVDGKDHTDISHLHPAVIELLMDRLYTRNHSQRVLTLEIFSLDHLEKSLSVMKKYVK